VILAAVAGAIALLELGLRSLGFGKPLTYITDPQIGYLLSPNQTTCRFGNPIAINQYSMRSPEISLTRPENTLRILLIGDSIANGGWWTDQRQTISALLQQQLEHDIKEHDIKEFERVEVLNASANSWSPRNELAYLQRFGTFEAQVIVQLINTDDLFGIAPYSLVVGHDRNYPDRRPPFAIAEAVSRYLIPTADIPELDELWKQEGDRVGENLAAIEQVRAIAVQHNAQLLLAITPLLREVGGSRAYEQKARQRFTRFVEQQQMPFIDFLPLFQAFEDPQTLYRDSIHLNQTGNLQIVERLREKIEEILP
jgi:lysophospholipase L1-like esterase